MVLAEIAGVFAVLGVAQAIAGFILVKNFARQPEISMSSTPCALPPVTVLKPLCGDEPLLEHALQSCFSQSYPEFQIVFGVHHAADPALKAVERLRQRFPNRDIEVVIDPTIHGINRKLSNLINMLPFAKHDILVISDSDLHVPHHYLGSLVAELATPGTGLVTSLYFGRPPTREGWARTLGATQINHIFLPGVLVSRALGRQDCLGSTAMMSRSTLERIGGFRPLANVLAEDNVMGQLVRDLGLSIGLAGIVPAAIVPESTLAAVWQHEIRWVRTIRELAPALLCASTLQHPLFWSLIAMLVSGFAAWPVALFFFCWAVRAACADGIDRALSNRLGLPPFSTPFWLLPVRDVLSVVEIAASFLVNEVTWRGHKMAASGAVASPGQRARE